KSVPRAPAVFLFLTATFRFLAIGAFAMSTANVPAANYNGLYKFGGWLGLITALLGWYASYAAVTDSTFKRVCYRRTRWWDATSSPRRYRSRWPSISYARPGQGRRGVPPSSTDVK